LGERARILIVDDDEGIRKTLAAILEDEGYSVESVDSGREAIAKTNMTCYNLALIDIRLLDMQGTELLGKIKPVFPKMRKIIITGYPTIHNAIEAVNRNADAFLLKPFDMPKVLSTIREQLSKQNEEKRFSQEKVTAFIETRVKELETTGIKGKSK
jgi:DNA-binding NtrC family response regulator